MEKSLLCLKGDLPFRNVFFDDSKASALQSLAERMKLFVTGEEQLLEKSADHFHTNELEIINSRIVLIKDILWGLERDFLGNIDKIRALSPEAISVEGFGKYREINFPSQLHRQARSQGERFGWTADILHPVFPRRTRLDLEHPERKKSF